MKLARILPLPALLAVTLWGAALRADPAAEAETRYREGVALAKQGKHEEALAKFARSYALDPRASVVLGMALSEYELKRHVDAIRHFRAYFASPKAQNIEALRTKFFQPLYEETGHLRVHVGPGAELKVDGASTSTDDVVDVAPGAHRLAAGTETRDITVARGQTVEVDLAPAPPAPVRAEVTPPVTAPPPEPPAEPSGSSKRWLVAGGLGVASVIAAGVGVGFLVARNGHVSDAQDVVSKGSPCVDVTSASCAAYDSANDGRRSAERGEAIAFGAAAVLAGAAAVSFFLLPQRAPSARARLVPSWRGVSLLGSF